MVYFEKRCKFTNKYCKFVNIKLLCLNKLLIDVLNLCINIA